jgi:Beta-galactosidase
VRRVKRVLRLAPVLALLLAVCVPASAQAKRRVPVGFFGTVLEAATANVGVTSDAALDSTMALMARSGVESLRVSFSWDVLEPAANFYNFAYTDRVVRDAARHGIRVLANLIYTPAWASSGPHNIFTYRYAPRDPRSWSSFVTTVVKRYGPHGVCWAQNPGLPHLSVREWQIWNEQAFNAFWASRPWARTYTKLLRGAYQAIHRLDHGAKVVAGSLAADAQSNQWQQMAALYKAGARRYFNMISVHPFTLGTKISVKQSVAQAVEIVRRVHNVMRRHHDGRKPIILTELSWPGAVGKVKKSRLFGLESTPHGEMLRLAAAYKYLATHRRQTDVTQAYWFSWASTFNPNDPQSDVGYRFAGLNRYSNGQFFPQPVLRTYASVARHYEGCRKTSSGRCA